MRKQQHTFAEVVMQRRGFFALVLAAITILFALGLPKVELKTIFSDLLPKNHPFVETYTDHPNFGNPLSVTVLVKHKDGDIFNADTLQKVWDLTREIDLTPGVDHDQILSVATEKARYAQATPYGIDSRPLMGDAPPKTAEEISGFRDALYKSPNARLFLVSEDESGALIKATFIERLLDYGEAHAHLQNMVEQARDAQHEVHIAGQPMLTGWVYRYEVQMLFIFSITGAALLLALILYMRNFVGVFIPLIASVVAAVWGFGLVGWLELPVEPLIMVVPLLLVARSFSHCVQFIERYFEILSKGVERRLAAQQALAVMASPSILGIVTDATGLLLIAIAPIPAMERFALFCGFWAMMFIPTNVMLAPILLSWLPVPANAARLTGAGEKGFYAGLRHMLSNLARLTYGSAGRVTAVVLLLMSTFSIWNVTNIKVGNPVEGSSLLKPSSEYNVAVEAINRGFPGLNTLEVVFEAKQPETDLRVARQSQTVELQSQLQLLLEQSEHPPEASLSFADYLPEANRLFSGGNPKWSPIDPTDQAAAAAVGALMVGTSPKAFSHVTDFELKHSTVSFWYKDNKQETVAAAVSAVTQAVDQLGREFQDVRIRLSTGTIALQQSLNDTVDLYQWYILGALNVVILVACGIAYRSVVAGLLLLIPVNLSNFFLGVIMTLMDLGLDVNTLPITAIGIGVGIDYGIYLLTRICEEHTALNDIPAAIVRAVSTTGKAIFFTASIVLIGILPWYFLSELKFLADMGLLLVMVMLINMLVALIVVPLLVWLTKPAFVMRRGDGNANGLSEASVKSDTSSLTESNNQLRESEGDVSPLSIPSRPVVP